MRITYLKANLLSDIVDSEISDKGMKIALKTAQLLAKLPVNLNLNNPALKLHNL